VRDSAQTRALVRSPPMPTSAVPGVAATNKPLPRQPSPTLMRRVFLRASRASSPDPVRLFARSTTGSAISLTLPAPVSHEATPAGGPGPRSSGTAPAAIRTGGGSSGGSTAATHVLALPSAAAAAAAAAVAVAAAAGDPDVAPSPYIHMAEVDELGRVSLDEPSPPFALTARHLALPAASPLGAASSAESAASSTSTTPASGKAPRIRTGIFNVKTTSTKPLPDIVREVIRVLTENNVPYERRDDYHFLISPGLNRPGPPRSLQPAGTTPTGTPTHALALPANPSSPGQGKLARILAEPAPAHLNVRIELEVCRVFGLGMHGIRLRRLSGDTWAYQALCNALLEQLHL